MREVIHYLSKVIVIQLLLYMKVIVKVLVKEKSNAIYYIQIQIN